MALLEDTDGLVARLFARMEVPLDGLKSALTSGLRKRPQVSGPGAEPGKVFVTQRLQKTLLAAQEEAKRLINRFHGIA